MRLARLLRISDQAVRGTLAFILSETLAAGSLLIEALGPLQAVNSAWLSQADEATGEILVEPRLSLFYPKWMRHGCRLARSRTRLTVAYVQAGFDEKRRCVPHACSPPASPPTSANRKKRRYAPSANNPAHSC